jgi:RimJ/RimL family protein N-acetyltransferase
MSPFPRTPSTDRLTATPVVAAADTDAFAPLFADPAISDRMWPAHLGGPRSREQTEAWLARYEAHWAAFGFGPWTVRERDGGAVVAHVGLSYTVVAGAAEVEVGAIVAPDRWGRGYARETVALALSHAPSIRGLASVVAFAEPVNARAVTVIEATGFVYERDTTVVELDHVLYRARVG